MITQSSPWRLSLRTVIDNLVAVAVIAGMAFVAFGISYVLFWGFMTHNPG